MIKQFWKGLSLFKRNPCASKHDYMVQLLGQIQELKAINDYNALSLEKKIYELEQKNRLLIVDIEKCKLLNVKPEYVHE